jgi:ABC-type glycerol-3-phosphate transport system substrate-binding protein
VSWEGVPLLKREIARFAELHGIRVKVTEVPKTDSKLLSVLRGGGTPPDVIMVQSDYIPDLVEAKAIQNVDSFVPETITSKGLFSFSAGGKVWAVPFYFDSQLLFSNPRLVREPAASSWTLSDMERIAARIAGTGVVPMSWNVYSAYWLVPFQVSFGKIPFLRQTVGPDR